MIANMRTIMNMLIGTTMAVQASETLAAVTLPDTAAIEASAAAPDHAAEAPRTARA